MSAKIIDGKNIADKILNELKSKIKNMRIMKFSSNI